MASDPTKEDYAAIENISETTIDKISDYLYFNPIGIVDSIKTNIKVLPSHLNGEIDKKIGYNTYNVRIFYMAFEPPFDLKKSIIEKEKLSHAKKIAISNEDLPCILNVKRTIISSSELLNKKFGTNDLYWSAFWGFKIGKPKK